MKRMHLLHGNECSGFWRARRPVVLAAALLSLMTAGCGSPSYESVGTPQSAVESGGSPDGWFPEEAGSAGKTESADKSGDAEKTDGTGRGESGTASVFVYVCGAVRTPGVYRLPAGSRVYQAIGAAGGLTGDAEDRMINQAQTVSDGEQITVPTRTEAASMPQLSENGAPEVKQTGGSASAGVSADGKVNINTADSAALQTLNGIGASRAEEIIAYREGNGRFGCIEDIMKVSGIKTALFEKIKDRITVD